ncbi:MAG: hypothetical protein J5J00_08985 [Deltaproteobacteria bacterium]|nr:hypothetical protein [Deltaproteobacteria bacterium]
MKTRLLAALISIWLIRPVPLHAQAGAPSPAASLLIPYFELGADACSGASTTNTTVRVTNFSAASQLAHVTFWTNAGVPTFAFDLSLIGYGTESFDVKEIFCGGKVPLTPEPSTVFPEPLTPSSLAHLRAWHSGEESPATKNCAGHPVPSGAAVGYITIDDVMRSGLGFPSDGDAYFSQASFDNVLVGDAYFETFEPIEQLVEDPNAGTKLGTKNCKRKRGKKKERCRIYNKVVKSLPPPAPTFKKTEVLRSRGLNGIPAVHLKALGNLLGPVRTFYGRYVTNGSDRRSPLASAYGVQYSQVESENSYELLVWREGTGKASPFACKSGQLTTLANQEIVVFDDFSNAQSIEAQGGNILFPRETQLEAGVLSLLPFQSGWIYLNFQKNMNDPAQAWVIRRRDGLFDASGVAPVN